MIERLWLGKPAEISFTCDFHELVAGELRPGAALLLRYDPQRIVPPAEPYRFGDPDRPVIAHLRFHAHASPLDLAMHSPAGIIPCPDVDPTGQGSMLSAGLSVPADAEQLSIWFSYRTTMGALVHDSDFGANYWFGFPGREIAALQAAVAVRPDQAFDRFEVSLSAAPALEAVVVPFLLVADPACAKHEVALERADGAAAQPDMYRWVGSIDVPHGAVVRFKVRYWIGGRRLIDDNAGAWYLAPEPVADRPPPPTASMLEAAAAWR